ncbi:SDR family NAD(P)-dependent oxidoreductase [Streptomyces justiciae]|uniref:SDR family NAD(P)-dependent oxidoreductase n=1 Tax=Streptomyces justiciae TaxID=2780140 RepID=UPI002117328F|nr:SDR family NAD(P)-dependent oxidoreductase [Streptomyces justiciae]MCW8375460.1 SDR family NAD(P)-dependent oxidoreductase [Streptomyces justiciae]
MTSAVVIGAGPGIGLAVARRFAREGFDLALVGRNKETVTGVADGLEGVRALPLVADSSDEVALRAALDTAAAELGAPDVVVYNAAVIRPDAVGELPLRAHLDTYAVNVLGALTAAAHTAPGMAERGHGTFVVTGGMPEPKPEYVSLSLGKAGVRALIDLLDRQYGPSGVHVATVTVSGPVAPGTAWDPDEIAEQYWRLHTQPRAEWEREIVL